MENTAENEVTTVTEEVADPQAETSPSDSKKAETKGVSERINKIRADYDAQ